jgi:hypothetical protein
LWWGVEPVVDSLSGAVSDIGARVIGSLREQRRLPSPATVVLLSGNPDLEGSEANFVRLRRV